MYSPPSPSDAETCGVCEVVIQYVDSILVENATIADIKNALDKICNFLPDTMKKEVRRTYFLPIVYKDITL